MGATSTHRPRRILREVDRMTGRLKVGVHCITVTDGARVTYAVDGAGEPVLVLLHGGGGSYRDFEHWVPRLISAGFRVVRPEMRPHAFVDLPRGTNISHARIARDVKEILDSLNVRAAHFAGWSHGGCVALRLRTTFLVQLEHSGCSIRSPSTTKVRGLSD